MLTWSRAFIFLSLSFFHFSWSFFLLELCPLSLTLDPRDCKLRLLRNSFAESSVCENEWCPYHMCPHRSGKDPFSRGRAATGSKAWTASATTSCASAGRGAGWWWRTLSSCTWTETTAGSTLCCCLTPSSTWRWAAPSRTPSTECASRTSPGRSAVFLPAASCGLCIYASGVAQWPVSFFFCAGIWSLSVAATDRPTGGVMKSTIWQTPVISSKCSASRASLRREKTRSQNGLIWKKHAKNT